MLKVESPDLTFFRYIIPTNNKNLTFQQVGDLPLPYFL